MPPRNTRKLNKLVKERAYTAGELKRKRRAIDQRGIGSIQAKLSRIDQQITSLNSEVDPEVIRAVIKKRTKLPLERGRFTAELARIMIESAGTPISTTEIRLQLGERLGLPTATADDRKLITLRLQHQLYRWMDDGAVTRVPRVGPGRSNGLWVWVGL